MSSPTLPSTPAPPPGGVHPSAPSPSFISHVAIKPPPFYKKSPETWFRQLESQFCLGRVSSPETKFHHALAALPEDIACDIDPAITEYDQLKTSVLDSLRANRFQLIEEALASIELGSRRPAQFVLDVKRRFSEVGLKADDAVIKSRLLSALPPTLRSALVAHEGVDVDTFAKIADSMIAVTSSDSSFSVSRVETAIPQRPPPLAATKFAPRPFYSSQRPKICNAHIYYGSKARTCRQWCQWPGQKPSVLKSGQQTPSQSRPSSPLN